MTVTDSPASAPGALRRRLRHLPSGLAASGVLLIVAVLGGWAFRGGTGALGAALGVALVAIGYTASSVIVAWADAVNPRLVLLTALTTYIVKFGILGLVMWRVAATGWSGLPPMGVAIIAATIAWGAAQAVWTFRAKIPYVEIES
jgi:hypothetical protein